MTARPGIDVDTRGAILSSPASLDDVDIVVVSDGALAVGR
jgi:hypothetical protein